MTAEQFEAFREAKAICEGLADESRANPFGVLAVVALDLEPEERGALQRVLNLIRLRREASGAAGRERVEVMWEAAEAME